MDRRATRTRQALRDALVALATEKAYDRIRVQDLLDRSGVGRTTFYAHFADTEDLLVTLFLEMMDRIEARIDPRSPLALPSAEDLFEHFSQREALCRGLRRADKMETLYRAAESRLARFFERRFGHAGQRQASMAAAHAAASFIALWRWWTRDGRRVSPREMAAAYEELVGPSLRALNGDRCGDAGGPIEAAGRPADAANRAQ